MRAYYRLVLWSIFWALVWPFALLTRKKRDNCLTWAMKRWEENPEGYLVIRWSRSAIFSWLRWPHFLFIEAEDERMHHLMPKNANDVDKHVVPAVWFEGEVTEGDALKNGYEN